MPHRVHTAVDPVEPSGVDEPTHRALGVAELEQLAMRHDPVLSTRQLRQTAMRTHFFPHSGTKCVRAQVLPSGEHLFARVESSERACL
jgi:hypothetical protein